MAARGRVYNNIPIKHRWTHISLNTVIRVAVCLLIPLGLLLYISIFISPALLRNMLLAVDLCNDNHDHSTAATTASNVILSKPIFRNALDATHSKDMKEEHSRLEFMESEDSIELLTSRSNILDAKTASTICKLRKGAAAGSRKDQEREQEPAKESDFLVQLSRDARPIKVNCCSCEPKIMDAELHHGLNHGSTNENPNIADDETIVQERRIGESTGDPKRFTILIGVMTMASKIDRRNLLRLAYAVQSSPDAHISVRFVIGGFEGGVEKTLVGMENATYGDIIVLNCTENLNEGKTFTFFSSLPDRGVEYDYVMKTDDDSYIRFENLGRSLKPLQRTDLYYGYILPCENEDPYSSYMAGMGYLISWDLVLWIKDSPVPRNKSVGTEDQLVGDWFNEGGVAKNRVNEKPLIYDHPEFGGNCAHKLVHETILVHQVKTQERWANVLDFFEKDLISRALSLSLG